MRPGGHLARREADLGIRARITVPVRASGSPATVVAAFSTRKAVRSGVLMRPSRRSRARGSGTWELTKFAGRSREGRRLSTAIRLI